MALLSPPEEQGIIIPDGTAYDYMTDIVCDSTGQTVVYNAPFNDTDENGENSKTNAGCIYINQQKVTPREADRQRLGTNYFLQNRSLDQSPWASTVGTLSQNVTGADGTANKAWTIGDTSAGATQHIYQQISVTGNTTNGYSFFVRKKSIQSFPYITLQVLGGSSKTLVFALDLLTGVYDVKSRIGTFDFDVTPFTSPVGDQWWKVRMMCTDDGSNTTATCWISPAAYLNLDSSSINQSLQGSIEVDFFTFKKGLTSLGELDFVFSETTSSSVTNESAAFGHHVDISADGKVVVTSARGQDYGKGAFFIVTKGNGSGKWRVVKKVQPSWVNFGDKFGFSVGIGYDAAIDKYIIACGAPFATSTQTARGVCKVYSYDLATNAVSELGELSPTYGTTDKNFGYCLSVAKNASVIAVSSRESNLDGEVAYFLRESGWGNKSPEQTLDLIGSNQYFGITNSASPTTFAYKPVALSPDGTWLAVGAHGENSNVGTVRIYTNLVSGVSISATYNGDTAGEYFGGSLAISEDYLLIGEQGSDRSGTDQGSVFYAAYTTSWGSTSRLQADTPIDNNYFGYAMAISDNHLFIVASDYNDTGKDDIGAYYKFLYQDGGTMSATNTEVQLPVDYFIAGPVKKKKK